MDFDLDLAIEVLRRSPATLRALLDGLSEHWVRGTEGPETFSPFDVVGHLIDGEDRLDPAGADHSRERTRSPLPAIRSIPPPDAQRGPFVGVPARRIRPVARRES